METEEVDPGLPLLPTLLIIGLLLLIVAGLVIWLILTRQTLSSHDLTQNQSPYCLTVGCPTGTNLLNYELNPDATGNNIDYETFNWCSVNAPPTSFIQSLELCAGLVSSEDINPPGVTATISAPTASQLTSFADFYNNNYVDTCGWSWKNPPPTLGPSTNGQTYPNDAQPDPVISALMGCAIALNVDTDPNVQALATKNGKLIIFPNE